MWNWKELVVREWKFCNCTSSIICGSIKFYKLLFSWCKKLDNWKTNSTYYLHRSIHRNRNGQWQCHQSIWMQWVVANMCHHKHPLCLYWYCWSFKWMIWFTSMSWYYIWQGFDNNVACLLRLILDGMQWTDKLSHLFESKKSEGVRTSIVVGGGDYSYLLPWSHSVKTCMMLKKMK